MTPIEDAEDFILLDQADFLIRNQGPFLHPFHVTRHSRHSMTFVTSQIGADQTTGYTFGFFYRTADLRETFLEEFLHEIDGDENRCFLEGHLVFSTKE